MKRFIAGFSIFMAALVMSFNVYCAPKQETITVTTYYPAPYGSYKVMQLQPNARATSTDPTPDNNAPFECTTQAHKGRIYYETGAWTNAVTGEAVKPGLVICTEFINAAGTTTLGWKPMVDGGNLGDMISPHLSLVDDGTGNIILNPLNQKFINASQITINKPMNFGAQAGTMANNYKFVCPDGNPPVAMLCSDGSTPKLECASGKVAQDGSCYDTAMKIKEKDEVVDPLTGKTNYVDRIGIGIADPKAILDIYGYVRTDGRRAIQVNGKPLIMAKRFTMFDRRTSKKINGKPDGKYDTGIKFDDYFCTATGYSVGYRLNTGGTPPHNVKEAVWTYKPINSDNWWVYVDYNYEDNAAAVGVNQGHPAVDVVCFNKDVVDLDFGPGKTVNPTTALQHDKAL